MARRPSVVKWKRPSTRKRLYFYSYAAYRNGFFGIHKIGIGHGQILLDKSEFTNPGPAFPKVKKYIRKIGTYREKDYLHITALNPLGL